VLAMESEPAPPNWLRDAVRGSVHEARLFVRTLWAITFRPSRFTNAWAEGRAQAMNPLAFIATCASLLTGLVEVLQRFGLPVGEHESFGAELLHSAGPFIQYAAAGVLAHVALIAIKPRRRLLDSIAVGLYSGGPALIGYLLWSIGLSIVWIHLGRPDTHGNGMLSMLSVTARHRVAMSEWIVVIFFVRSLWFGMAGLHRGRWIACGVATLASMMTLALILGRLGIYGTIGAQLVIVRGASGGFAFDIHD
jgi:hypothetical protein